MSAAILEEDHAGNGIRTSVLNYELCRRPKDGPKEWTGKRPSLPDKTGIVHADLRR